MRPSADAIDRSRWIDIARGVSILLVVMLHSALGVSKVLGTSNGLEEVVAFAKPFRMPGFFLLTGILAARADKLSCLEFIDRKVVRFVYFYFIWGFAILLSKAMISGEVSAATLLLPGIESLLEPLGSLWYIYVLPFLFLTVRALGEKWVWAGLLVALPLHLLAAVHLTDDRHVLMSTWTGRMAFDSYALFLVFFLLGRALSSHVEFLARWVRSKPQLAVAFVGFWFAANLFFLKIDLVERSGGLLVAGIAGGGALLACAVLIADNRFTGWLAYCGRHSLPIYLAFVLPMGATRTVLVDGVGLMSGAIISLAVMAGAVGGPLLFEFLVRNTWAGFLFSRPQWARIKSDLT